METYEENKEEFLLFTEDIGQGKEILEKVPSLPSRLYYTYIKLVPYVAYKVIFQNVDTFQTWHDCLCHPGIGMMRKIISNSIGHGVSDKKFPQSLDFMCTSCASGKLILRLSHLKIQAEPLKFLERIQGDMCIHSTFIRVIQILHDSHLCIHKMVTCVPLVNAKPCICKVDCTSHMT